MACQLLAPSGVGPAGLCVCQAAGALQRVGGLECAGGSEVGGGAGDLGLLKGQQVVEMRGQLALQDSGLEGSPGRPPPASALTWTQCQVCEGIESWPQPKRPRHSLFT